MVLTLLKQLKQPLLFIFLRGLRCYSAFGTGKHYAKVNAFNDERVLLYLMWEGGQKCCLASLAAAKFCISTSVEQNLPAQLGIPSGDIHQKMHKSQTEKLSFGRREGVSAAIAKVILLLPCLSCLQDTNSL